MRETNSDRTKLDEIKDNENTESKDSHIWYTYSEIENLIPKYFMFFKSKWIILIQISFSAIIILFELIFRFTNELYSQRPVNIYVSIFTPILSAIGLVIYIFILRLFFIYSISTRDEIINELDIKPKQVTKEESKSRSKVFDFIKRIRIILYIILPIICILIIGIFNIRSYIQIGPGYYYPNMPISTFMIILRMIYSLFQFFTYINLGILIAIPINIIKNFPKEIDLDDLVLKPSQNDPSGGFRNLGLIVIKVTFVMIFLIIILAVIDGIELIVQRLITEPFTPMKENVLEIESLFEGLAPLIGFILFSMLVGLLAYLILDPYNIMLKNYKKKRLKPLLEKKHEILQKVFNENSQAKMSNRQLNELQKCNYLMTEINSISNWPVRFTLLVTILGSGFLPAIIIIIFKVIEVFVLK